jgi:hypothetical protein
MKLYHGTLRGHLPKIMKEGIEVGEGWGGAGTSGTFLSGTPGGALYWAKMAYQREHGEKLEVHTFDRDHGHEIDHLVSVVTVIVPESEEVRLMADEEQFEDVQADFDPRDWRQSLEKIGDVRFNGPIPPDWISDVIIPSRIDKKGKFSGNPILEPMWRDPEDPYDPSDVPEFAIADANDGNVLEDGISSLSEAEMLAQAWARRLGYEVEVVQLFEDSTHVLGTVFPDGTVRPRGASENPILFPEWEEPPEPGTPLAVAVVKEMYRGHPEEKRLFQVSAHAWPYTVDQIGDPEYFDLWSKGTKTGQYHVGRTEWVEQGKIGEAINRMAKESGRLIFYTQWV